MVLKGVDDGDDSSGNRQSGNPAPGSDRQRAQAGGDGREEEQRKAKKWLDLGWVIVGACVLISLVSASAFVKSVTIMAVLVSGIVALMLIWNVLFGICSIPSKEAWIIESRGIFLRVATKSPTILPLKGLITRVAQKISMKEIVGENIFGDKKLRLESTLIGVEADMTYIVEDFYKFFYSVNPDRGKTWKDTINDLIWATTRDALQTYASTEGPDKGPHTIDTIVKVKGANLSRTIFAGGNDKYKEIQDNFERWGIEIVTLIFGDFEESDEDMELKKEVLKAEQARKIAKIRIETQEMEGEAAAKEIARASREIAKNYAGITKPDKDLTPEERKIIASHVQYAEASYRKILSIAAVKPTDKIIVTQGTMTEKIDEDVIRELMRQSMSGATGERADKKQKKEKEQKKED